MCVSMLYFPSIVHTLYASNAQNVMLVCYNEQWKSSIFKRSEEDEKDDIREQFKSIHFNTQKYFKEQVCWVAWNQQMKTQHNSSSILNVFPLFLLMFNIFTCIQHAVLLQCTLIWKWSIWNRNNSIQTHTCHWTKKGNQVTKHKRKSRIHPKNLFCKSNIIQKYDTKCVLMCTRRPFRYISLSFTIHADTPSFIYSLSIQVDWLLFCWFFQKKILYLLYIYRLVQLLNPHTFPRNEHKVSVKGKNWCNKKSIWNSYTTTIGGKKWKKSTVSSVIKEENLERWTILGAVSQFLWTVWKPKIIFFCRLLPHKLNCYFNRK